MGGLKMVAPPTRVHGWRYGLCWALIIALSMLVPAQALAISKADKEAVLYDTPYYDPTQCQEAPAQDLTTDPKGSSSQEKAFDFYKKQGVSAEAAAGIVGNLIVESGAKLNTRATNGSHWGIVQWDAGRYAKMQKYAKDNNMSEFNLIAQLEYSWIEAKQRNVPEAMRSADTPEKAAVVWENLVENCGCTIDKRKTEAAKVFKKYGRSAAPDDDADTGSSVDPINPRLSLAEVANKHSLHSAIIKELDGDTIGKYKATTAPNAPGSTMKLIIVDVVLQDELSLNKTLRVSSELHYGGDNDLGGNTISVRDAIKATLGASSNVGANVLIKALGGVDAFSTKAHKYGYTKTTMEEYYQPGPDNNTSTIRDQAEAMSRIFDETGEGYKIAQKALQDAANGEGNHFNVEGVIATKGAWTDEVAGNVGKFKISNKDYIIGLYYEGNSSSEAAKKAIREGSADLVKLIKTGIPSSADSIIASCCPNVATDGTPGNSNGSDAGVWSSGLSAPFIVEQYAIEVLKNLAKKKGVEESKAVTKEHVLALVTWVLLEGGDIANDGRFNLYNTGKSAPELNDGAHTANGLGSYKSFDAGVEATTRTLAQADKAPMAKALLDPNTTAIQVGHAESYLGTSRYPGTTIWAEAAHDNPAAYESKWKTLIRQVRTNYKDTAALVIGTTEKELITGKREPGKLQFDGSGTVDADDDTANGKCTTETDPSADAAGVAQMAIKLSWPDASHGSTPNQAYRNAFNDFNPSGPGYDDCGAFVATVMRASGADKSYPPGGTSNQEAYVRAHPEKYDVKNSVESTADLEPGDILIVNQGSGQGASGHTLIYVGKQKPKGFDAASASLNSRAGNLGPVTLSDHRGTYLRARLK